MLTPDEREKRAIKLIATSTEGSLLVEYLEKNLLSQDEDNRLKEDVQMYRGQGASIMLDELIKLVKS